MESLRGRLLNRLNAPMYLELDAEHMHRVFDEWRIARHLDPLCLWAFFHMSNLLCAQLDDDLEGE